MHVSESSAFLLTALALALPGAAQDTASDEQASVEIAFENAFPGQERFDRPVLIEFHDQFEGQAFVVEQTGNLFQVPRDPESADRHLVADFTAKALHPRNDGGNEEGLLGFAFAPDFVESGYVFVYFSDEVDRIPGDPNARNRRRRRPRITRDSVVSRFETKRENGLLTFDMDSELEILRLRQPWSNHNGGTVIFGPDQMLYVVLGDGGAANDMGGNGQNLETLLAAVLRLDVSGATESSPYKVPADNPFVGDESARDEIWAYGLRNPWRISFDPETGHLWYADVGQNLWEEVGRLQRGGNFGWPLMEGFEVFPPDADRSEGELKGLVPPIGQYAHQRDGAPDPDGGLSVTGGEVYRGQTLTGLKGRYVFGDFVTRNVWAVRDGADPNSRLELLGKAPGPISSIHREPEGELLFCGFDGRIVRLVSGDD
ncbi:MAG: PQQ-dependent sugar dehydrogenase [Planctomycetota bacterium]